MIADVADPVRRLRDVILEAEDDATAWRAAIFLMSRDHPNPVVEALVTQRETIGEQALASMAEHGLKQHEVAREAGGSQSAVSRLRTGGYVSHQNKVAIAKAVARILAARNQVAARKQVGQADD